MVNVGKRHAELREWLKENDSEMLSNSEKLKAFLTLYDLQVSNDKVPVLCEYGKSIDNSVAKADWYFVATHTEHEIECFLDSLDVWKTEYSERDKSRVNNIFTIYGSDIFAGKKVLRVNNHYFVLSKEDYNAITAVHYDKLRELSLDEKSLLNPVLTSIGDNGSIIIDD